MKKLTFTFAKLSAENLINLLKGISEISCRAQLNFSESTAIVQDIDKNSVERIIELFYDTLHVSNITIENLVVDTTNLDNNETSSNMQNASNNVCNGAKIETSYPNGNEIDLIDVNGTEIDGSEDAQLDEKNEHIDYIIKKLKKTANWAVTTMDANPKVVGGFIWSAINEISCAYQQNNLEISVGDVVICNYGLHFEGEAKGFNIPAVVCHIKDDFLYLVPLAEDDKLQQENFLHTTFENFLYKNFDDKYSSVVLDYSRYVNSKRAISVCGKVTSNFMQELLSKLAVTFDFANIDQSDSKQQVQKQQVQKQQDTKQETAVSVTGETVLLEIISSNLQNLSDNVAVEDKVKQFLADIKFPTDKNGIVESAFVVACSVSKITFENVVNKLFENYPDITEGKFKKVLKTAFKTWYQYPELCKKSPKISIISLLKVVAKEIQKN